MKTRPLILWDNLIGGEPGPVITHSDDAEGHPFANLHDWRDYTSWRSSESGDLFIKLDASSLPGQAVSVDSLAIAGHNLAGAGVENLVLAGSDDDLAYTPCFEPVTPDDDRVLFRHFPALTRRYFKLTIPEGYAEPPELGVCFIGRALELPAYPEPGFDPDGQEIECAVEVSRLGRLLGSAERFRRRELRASFSRLPSSFISGEWLEFWKRHGLLPFFFAWDPDERPGETYLVRLASHRFSSPFERAFRSLTLELTGLVE